MENASGRNTLKASILTSLRNLVLRPQSLLFSKPFALICMVYGGTYLSANALDTITSTIKNKPATLVTSGPMKFAVPSIANIGLCLFKDQAFVRMFGPQGGPARPVGPASFALFAIRDSMTIFASFNIPPLLGPRLSAQMGEELQKQISGQTIAQFLAPASIQLFSTPLHLLGLDLYNRQGKSVSWADRWRIVKKNWGVSAAARICKDHFVILFDDNKTNRYVPLGRIVPAFGVGGVVNSKVRKGLMEKLA